MKLSMLRCGLAVPSVALAVALLVPASPDGAFAAESDSSNALREKLKRKVIFNFKNKPLSDAVASLQKMSGIKMAIDPSARKIAGNPPISLRVDGLPLSLALHMMLQLVDLDYSVGRRGILIIPRKLPKGTGELGLPEGLFGVENKANDSGAVDIIRSELERKVNIDFVETPLWDAINIVQLRVQVTMLMEPGVGNSELLDSPVNLKVRNMKASEALTRILEPVGLDFRIRPQSEAIQIFAPKNTDKSSGRESARSRAKTKTRYDEERKARMRKMRTIRNALYSHAEISRKGAGRFPGKLSELFPKHLRSLDAFVRRGGHGPAGASQIDRKTSYALVQGLTLESRHDAVLAYEKTPDARGKVLALFLDGHMEWIPSWRFPRLLKERSMPKSAGPSTAR